MKKIILLVVISMLLTVALISCKQNKGANEVAEIKEPSIEQIRMVGDLATMKCYYHNVAKSKLSGNLLKKERDFWIEYDGIAKIGVDMTKVYMEIDGNCVKVGIPNAELLDIGIDEESLNEDSYISSADGLIIKNKITADMQTSAISNAQNKMTETVKNNSDLLLTAQSRAKELIGNYIKKMGEISFSCTSGLSESI